MLNKRLALLTKIDNNPFVNIENVAINKLIDNIIENFKELGQDQILFDSNNALHILMEVLGDNLISKAIIHHNDK